MLGHAFSASLTQQEVRPAPAEGRPCAPLYHVQDFAFDATLDLPPHGGARATLLDALRGHVLTGGETIGTYER